MRSSVRMIIHWCTIYNVCKTLKVKTQLYNRQTRCIYDDDYSKNINNSKINNDYIYT